jgi:hypothetical protein
MRSAQDCNSTCALADCRAAGWHASRVTGAAAHLAFLVVLEQVLAAVAARELAVGLVAREDVLPQLLAHSAAAPKLALRLRHLALGAVPQEEEPALLLLDVQLPFLQLPLLHCAAFPAFTCIALGVSPQHGELLAPKS